MDEFDPPLAVVRRSVSTRRLVATGEDPGDWVPRKPAVRSRAGGLKASDQKQRSDRGGTVVWGHGMARNARRSRLAAFMSFAVLTAAPTAIASAAETELLAPQTRLRLTIVQWAPAKGQYERWDSLGGEYVVSAAGTVTTPIVGPISVSGLDGAGLAKAIAQKLQAKIGLVKLPDATVEIVEYPPVYVVGDVATPGERRFRAGLTVLQAFAMSGGAIRATSPERNQDEIKLVGEMRWVDESIIRSRATIARLQAEMEGAKEIHFDAAPDNVSTLDRTAEIYDQEKIIFSARTNGIDRQSRSFMELKNLLHSEIEVLDQKIKDADTNIASTSLQVVGVKSLVDRGYANKTNLTDVQRDLANYRTGKLDQLTATMRARQSISEATRHLDELQDQRRTEIAYLLQKEQANLDSLQLKREMNQRLLLETNSSSSDAADRDRRTTMAFSIVRRGGGSGREFPASDSMPLEPGDVLKVRIDRSGGAEPEVSDLDAAASADHVVR